MSKRFYQEWNPSKQSIVLISHIETILVQYEEMGYQLTLRQLYYQLVSKDLIENSLRSYNKIGNIVNKGRLSGLIDWAMIEDRVRIPVERSHWDSPKEIIKSAAHNFYKPHWNNQDYYVEVWCEKDAISNIIQPICRKWDVTFMANRGYSSQSAMYEASQRLYWKMQDGKSTRIIYLGDHDPSGIDMTRDIDDRLGVFLYSGTPYGDVERIALNMDQIDELNPPENPAKMTDSRFETYHLEYGTSSWELDALEPKVLEGLVEHQILEYIDKDKWDMVETEQDMEQKKLFKIAEDF